MRRYGIFRAVFLFAGIFLLLVNVFGILTFSPLEPRGEGIPGYDFPLRDVSELEELLASPPEIENLRDLDEINSLVFESIFHTDERKYSLAENYVLFLGGYLHEEMLRPQDPMSIMRGGGGLCNEIAAVLRHVLAKAGVESSFIGLDGHVALEVEIDGRRVVADPDYGVVYGYPLEVLEERGDAIIPGAMGKAGYPGEMIEYVVDVFMDSDGNTVLAPGQELSPRLALIERAAFSLKWVIPAVLILSAFGGAAGKNVTVKQKGIPPQPSRNFIPKP